MLKFIVICKSELDINFWCKYWSVSVSLFECWIKIWCVCNWGLYRKVWGWNMEIR